MKWGKKTLEITDGDWLACRRPSNELTQFPIPCGDEYCNIPKLLFSAPCVAWSGIGRELACCCGPCWTPCVSWTDYWKRVCLLLWSLIVAQLTLTDHMLKALISWIHHTRDDQLDECHCGMPPYLTQSVHFHHVVLLSSGHFASGWSFAFLTSNVFCWNPFFGGFRSLFDGFNFIWILDGVVFIFWFLLNIFFRTSLSTEQSGQSEG
jgi:hypothetical protein